MARLAVHEDIVGLVAFPLIVLLGAGSKTTDPTSTRICKFLGDISYPIYITHYPLIYMHMDFARTHADAPLWIHIAVSAGIFFFAIIMAYGVFKMYDEPVRKWLTEHWLKGEQRLPRWLKITGCTLAVLALFSGLYHTNKLKFAGLTYEAPTVQTTRQSNGSGQMQSAPAPAAAPASQDQSSAPADSSSAEN